VTGQIKIVEPDQQVTLEPFSWHMFDHDGNYLGLISKYGGPFGRYTSADDPLRFRAYATGLGLDGGEVAVEAEFPTQTEAVAWLLDGAES
jgi:hypothetical protein